jgi:anti-sigma factor RsiW
MKHLTESTIDESLDGALPLARQQAVAVHLNQCPACRSRLEDLRRVADSLAALPDEPFTRDLAPAVLSALPAKRPALAWRLALGAQVGLALGLVALAVRRSGPVVRALLDAAVRPVLSLPHLAPRWSRLPALRLPSLSLPAFHMPAWHLPAFHLPQVGLTGLDLAPPHLVLLASAAAALFVVGNSILLGSPSRPRAPRRNRK